MSSAATKLLTADEFFQWVQLPANRGFELKAGEVLEMPPPGKYRGFVCGNISRILGNYAIVRHTGYVCTNDAAFDECSPLVQAAYLTLGRQLANRSSSWAHPEIEKISCQLAQLNLLSNNSKL